MLAPRKVKHRKLQKGRRRGMANSGDYVSFGTYGLKALEPGWITSRQIESTRVIISRKIRKVGRMWIRIFPHKPVTKKPAEVRMGKGKGDIDRYVAPIKKGTMLYEIAGVDEELAREALRLASNKLPVRTRVVARTRGQLT